MGLKASLIVLYWGQEEEDDQLILTRSQIRATTINNLDDVKENERKRGRKGLEEEGEHRVTERQRRPEVE